MMALMNYVMTLVLVNPYKAQIGKDFHGTGVFHISYAHHHNPLLISYNS